MVRESRSPSRSWEQGWAPRRGHLWPRSGRLSAEMSLTGEEKKKKTNPKPEKIGEYFGSQRLSRGFFFPARSGPRHSGNALVGSGTSSALGRGFTGASAAQNYFSTPRMSRQSPEQPRSLLSREGAPGTPHWCGQIHLPEGTSQGRGGIWGCSGGVRVSGDVTVTLGDVTGTLGGCARDTRGCQGHSGMCQ